MVRNQYRTASDSAIVAALDRLGLKFASTLASGIATSPLSGTSGTGSVDALTQRMTLADDDPAVVALQVMDDWDESGRAKVNPIAGQSGVAAGIGAVDSKTQRVTMASDDLLIAAGYEKVAANTTAQVLGSTGAQGDFLKRLIFLPASTSPGPVTLLDNAASTTVFVGGSSSLDDLQPFTLDFGIQSMNGAWKVTTGSDIAVLAAGKFT